MNPVPLLIPGGMSHPTKTRVVASLRSAGDILRTFLGCLPLAATLFAAHPCPDFDPAKDELRPRVLFSTKAKTNWYSDGWASSVVRSGDRVFFVFVDPSLHPQVGVHQKGETKGVPLEENYGITDDGHNEFSMAVDKVGTLHVLGDMHNNTLRYWVSKNPGDIDGGFERRFDAIPGTFSYYSFFKDAAGELYMVARSQSLAQYYVPGGRGVGLYRYHAEEKTWEALGALPSHPEAKYPVVYWNASGRGTTSYQMFKAHLVFDRKGWLHFTAQCNHQGSAKNDNYVVYALSKDKGRTFQRADGTPLELPMNLAVSNARPDVLEGGPAAVLAERSLLLLDGSDRPGVVWWTEGSYFLRSWNGKEWTPRKPLLQTGGEASAAFRMATLSDRQGTMTVTGWGKMIRLKDFDSPPAIFPNPGSMLRHDRMAPDLEKTLTGLEWNSKSGDFRVIQVDLVNPTRCP